MIARLFAYQPASVLCDFARVLLGRPRSVEARVLQAVVLIRLALAAPFVAIAIALWPVESP